MATQEMKPGRGIRTASFLSSSIGESRRWLVVPSDQNVLSAKERFRPTMENGWTLQENPPARPEVRQFYFFGLFAAAL